MSVGHLGIKLNYKATSLALYIVQFAPKSRDSDNPKRFENNTLDSDLTSR